MKDVKKITKLVEKNLELSEDETKIFLYIIYEGMKDSKQICHHFDIPLNLCKKFVTSLISKNMLIEYTQDNYESFHPRFAVANRYKKLCQEKNVEFKKNILVDSLGSLLEGPYDIARTK